MKPTRLLMIIALAGLLAGPHAAQASGKHFTTITAPQAGTAKGQGTNVTGINQRGDIVGYFVNKQGTYGFLLHHGRYTTIKFPGTQYTELTGINRQGDIVGDYVKGKGANWFLLHQGKYQTIRFPTAGVPGMTHVTGINARGEIVGWYMERKHMNHGFLLQQGTYTVLDHPKALKINWGGNGTFATGISDTGDIVGYYVGKGPEHGFLLRHGKYTTFDAPRAASPVETGTGDTGTYALAINQVGDIVGKYTDNTMLVHGFLLHQGTFTVLDDPRAIKAAPSYNLSNYGSVASVISLQPGTRAAGINSRGEVVGTYVDSKGVSHGFIWR